MKERYCPYHRAFVPDEGFKIITDIRSGTKRGMCPDCQARRRLPRAELQAMADREKALYQETSRKMKKAAEAAQGYNFGGKGKDLAGRRFGRWSVLDLAERGAGDDGHLRWNAVCDCGTQRSLAGVSLTSGGSQSCGCAPRPRNAKQNEESNV